MKNIHLNKEKDDEVNSIPIEFESHGSAVRGKFYAATKAVGHSTLLLIPGWPGNSEDVMELGSRLSEKGIQVCFFNPRGMHQSEGTCSFANTLEDIRAALQWMGQKEVQERWGVDPGNLTLGGHSFGGGVALAYAAQDTSIRKVLSIAGNDHGAFIREFKRNPEVNRSIRAYLSSTRSPEGPVRFDLDETFRELYDHQDIYGLCENAGKLADRSILLVGGWEDQEVTIEDNMLPFYRALRGAGAVKVTFLVYHTDHKFTNVRQRLASDIAGWVLG